jgi:hypothetical protein
VRAPIEARRGGGIGGGRGEDYRACALRVFCLRTHYVHLSPAVQCVVYANGVAGGGGYEYLMKGHGATGLRTAHFDVGCEMCGCAKCLGCHLRSTTG